MKRILILAFCALLPACGIMDKPQAIQAAAYYGTYKVLDNSSASTKPGRTKALRATSNDLARISDGSVSGAEVSAVLSRHLKDDAALHAFSLLLSAWFPAGVTASPELSELSRSAALGINAALPGK